MAASGVRLARMTDVDGIAEVNARAWRGRLGDVLPAAVLDGLQAGDLAMAWASGILNPPTPGHRVLVAVEDDTVVGYAALGPSQDPDADDATGELIALEVDPGSTRQGHGSRLMAASIDHARGLGMSAVSVWCAVGDEARRAFLQTAGWGPDSAFRDLLVGQDPSGADLTVREVRLVTDIGT